MKKWIVLLSCALPFAPFCGYAQESRQDVSVSAAAFLPRDTHGNAVNQTSTIGEGLLVSYRYMLTPHAAVEGNYGFDRDIYKFSSQVNNVRVHTQFQEFSSEIVLSAYNRGRFYPYIEGGIGGYLFGIINDNKTTYNPLKSSTQIGFPYGGGVAYELSPSFDLRIGYRGIIAKAPTFGAPSAFTNTGRYTNISNPFVGVAYHF